MHKPICNAHKPTWSELVSEKFNSLICEISRKNYTNVDANNNNTQDQTSSPVLKSKCMYPFC